MHEINFKHNKNLVRRLRKEYKKLQALQLTHSKQLNKINSILRSFKFTKTASDDSELSMHNLKKLELFIKNQSILSTLLHSLAVDCIPGKLIPAMNSFVKYSQSSTITSASSKTSLRLKSITEDKIRKLAKKEKLYSSDKKSLNYELTRQSLIAHQNDLAIMNFEQQKQLIQQRQALTLQETDLLQNGFDPILKCQKEAFKNAISLTTKNLLRIDTELSDSASDISHSFSEVELNIQTSKNTLLNQIRCVEEPLFLIPRKASTASIKSAVSFVDDDTKDTRVLKPTLQKSPLATETTALIQPEDTTEIPKNPLDDSRIEQLAKCSIQPLHSTFVDIEPANQPQPEKSPTFRINLFQKHTKSTSPNISLASDDTCFEDSSSVCSSSSPAWDEQGMLASSDEESIDKKNTLAKMYPEFKNQPNLLRKPIKFNAHQENVQQVSSVDVHSSVASIVTPPTLERPGSLDIKLLVICMHKFVARSKKEMSIDKGDIVVVRKQTGSWFYGYLLKTLSPAGSGNGCGGDNIAVGWIPKDFVEKY